MKHVKFRCFYYSLFQVLTALNYEIAEKHVDEIQIEIISNHYAELKPNNESIPDKTDINISKTCAPETELLNLKSVKKHVCDKCPKAFKYAILLLIFFHKCFKTMFLLQIFTRFTGPQAMPHWRETFCMQSLQSDFHPKRTVTAASTHTFRRKTSSVLAVWSFFLKCGAP